jgi:tetratricopeptide (TPR) repeat protein/transglutaminase-like putative cysteine protease
MRAWGFLVPLAAVPATAMAGETLAYAPAPAWVKPAPAIDATRLTADAPVILLYDNQQRLADGQVWAYVDSATRASTTQILGALGTVQLPWQPAHGDMIIHGVEIIRGAEHINLLKVPKTFTVIRREQQIERRVLDGVLTATMPVEGLRVNDILHVTYSVTTKDPTLLGNVQTVAPIVANPFRVQFARVRFLWPKTSDIRWKTLAEGITAQPTISGNDKELLVALPIVKQSDVPTDAPLRFQHIPLIEASSFKSWADVAAVMAPLYATEGQIAPGSPLAAEVARIAASESDPLKRAALALQLVQDKVRYLLLGMDEGNYVPQKPGETWGVRYGDCKAKTLLLLAILRALAIDAEPVLAHLQLGGVVADRLPAPAAFNHVLVKAVIGSDTLWLDGTGSGARLADIRDTPVLGMVLPIRARDAALLPVVPRAPARAEMSTILELDQSAGIMLPAPTKITVTLRGNVAEQLRATAAQANSDDLATALDPVVKTYLDSATIVSRAVSFDDAAATATVTATAIAYPDWPKENDRFRAPLDTLVAALAVNVDRARASWREIPVSTGAPSRTELVTRLRLPDKGVGFTLDRAEPVSQSLAGQQITRSVKQAQDWITVETIRTGDGREIAAADLPAIRKQLAMAKAVLPRAIAPAATPPLWQVVQQARLAHRFDPIIAAFTRRITAKPQDAALYTDRAWFHARIYDRQAAIADLTRAIVIQPDAGTYVKRAALFFDTGNLVKALADAREAVQLDPASGSSARLLATLQAEQGDRAGALALLQERADAGGTDKPEFQSAIAQIRADGGDGPAAIAEIDDAIAKNPGQPTLLNTRCWLKGLLNLTLDTALRDCTKSIELSESSLSALDSRALVYFRLKRFDDALLDLKTVLDEDPDVAGSLYLRGLIKRQTGDIKGSDADIAAARFIEPRVDVTYQRYGIKP